MNQMMPAASHGQSTIRDAYISVELKNQRIEELRDCLQETLGARGVASEEAASGAHVSIAYGQGEVALEEMEDAASAIARCGFNARAVGFEILEGLTTDFDYLVVALEQEGDFATAVEIAEERMSTRRFAGGMRSHVSLLRIRKEAGVRERLMGVLRELNACHGATRALGRCLEVEGEKVRVFDTGRRCRHECRMAPAALVA